MESFFSQYGTVVRIGIDRSTYTAMIQFDKVDEAKEALSRVKGEVIDNTQSKIMVRKLCVILNFFCSLWCIETEIMAIVPLMASQKIHCCFKVIMTVFTTQWYIYLQSYQWH